MHVTVDLYALCLVTPVVWLMFDRHRCVYFQEEHVKMDKEGCIAVSLDSSRSV